MNFLLHKIKCPFCGISPIIEKLQYDANNKAYDVYVPHCVSCDHTWLPIEEEKRLDKLIEKDKNTLKS